MYVTDEIKMSVFSTRELATAFWAGIILVAVGIAMVTNKNKEELYRSSKMLLRPEAKDAMGNISLVHRRNHVPVFKAANMEKYIFKRYYCLDTFFGADYLHERSCWRS